MRKSISHRRENGFDAFVDQIHTVIEGGGSGDHVRFRLPLRSGRSVAVGSHDGKLLPPDLPAPFRSGHRSPILRSTGIAMPPAGMEMITETTQYLLDVFRCQGRNYIKPIKVQHRSASAMNLIHAWEAGDRFRPVVDSGTLAEILAGSGWLGLEGQNGRQPLAAPFFSGSRTGRQAEDGQVRPQMLKRAIVTFFSACSFPRTRE